MQQPYLTTIPDEVKMTPAVFIELMNKYKHHRSVQYCFSTKHTQDIQEFKKSQGLKSGESSIPGNLYNLPVRYNCEVTGVK